MRTLRLARVAAQAEGLRLRRMARRQVVRAVMGAIAVVFLIGALIGAHVAAALALSQRVGPVYAALIVTGIDLVVAIVVGLLAMHNAPDRIEREALAVRETAQAQLLEAGTLTMIMGPVLRSLGARKAYGLTLAALTARYLGGRR